MQNQIPLFDTKEHQTQAHQRPRSTPALRGIIQRGLDELKDSDKWIERTNKLKFKRMEAQHGNL